MPQHRLFQHTRITILSISRRFDIRPIHGRLTAWFVPRSRQSWSYCITLIQSHRAQQIGHAALALTSTRPFAKTFGCTTDGYVSTRTMSTGIFLDDGLGNAREMLLTDGRLVTRIVAPSLSADSYQLQILVQEVKDPQQQQQLSQYLAVPPGHIVNDWWANSISSRDIQI